MGPFPPSYSNAYILVAVDYVSRWVEAMALPTNDAKVTSGQVEVSNWELKRILEKTVSTSRKDWARNSDDTLWAYRSAFKTLIEMSQYQLAYGEKRLLQLNDFDEFRNSSYENSKLYKEKTKMWHDKKIATRSFKSGQQVLLFNSRLKLFLGKLKSQWSGPFVITRVSPYGHVKLQEDNSDRRFTVNGQRLKHYLGGEIDRQRSTHLMT
ncbi:uncharacterized protein LOC107627155 [Arachis ipaensis]|uniref:uncharacterized protein LOC107627155 n=1 Tax=Arachis ipaensis TaxID=130454 RepID=UPI0007AFAD27|nr:uncharacterized protein LOC107627155 [Arachis ipaensis]XP_025635900.1 uncharacterized protein LOC112729992 [Arachis hypogaea]